MKSENASDDSSFESVLRRLENIVEKLESGESNLENLVRDYDQGMQLLGSCREKLAHAEMVIEKATLKGAGHKSEKTE